MLVTSWCKGGSGWICKAIVNLLLITSVFFIFVIFYIHDLNLECLSCRFHCCKWSTMGTLGDGLLVGFHQARMNGCIVFPKDRTNRMRSSGPQPVSLSMMMVMMMMAPLIGLQLTQLLPAAFFLLCSHVFEKMLLRFRVFFQKKNFIMLLWCCNFVLTSVFKRMLMLIRDSLNLI